MDVEEREKEKDRKVNLQGTCGGCHESGETERGRREGVGNERCG